MTRTPRTFSPMAKAVRKAPFTERFGVRASAAANRPFTSCTIYCGPASPRAAPAVYSTSAVASARAWNMCSTGQRSRVSESLIAGFTRSSRVRDLERGPRSSSSISARTLCPAQWISLSGSSPSSRLQTRKLWLPTSRRWLRRTGTWCCAMTFSRGPKMIGGCESSAKGGV